MSIIKSTGERQDFEPTKLRDSLVRVGASERFATSVSQQAAKNQSTLRSTQRVYDYAQQRLIRQDKKAAMRYRLKHAMFDLGPTGYPFERFVGRLLQEHGYQTQVGVFVRGYCVSHEVDVLAEKGNETYLFECKYHLRKGSRSNVKVALYVKARFDDIARGYREDKSADRQAPKKKIHGAWLVTNTKCTSEAIRFARCSGLNILSWRYPLDQNLASMIDSAGLYPVTVLLSLNPIIKRRLLSLEIVTVQDLLHFDDWSRIPKPERKFVARLREEARMLLA